MSLFEIILEVGSDLFGEVLGPGVVAIIRFPGAVLEWLIWRGRSFKVVWNKGDKFGQGMAGVLVYSILTGASIWLLSAG